MEIRDALRRGFQMATVRTIVGYERVRTGYAFNPLHPRLYANPYPIYRRLREQDPVHRSYLMGGYALTRYPDVLSVLRDERFSADDRNQRGFEKDLERRRRLGLLDPDETPGISMLRTDPPDHTRLRKLVSKAFTPRAVRELEPRIEQIVTQQLDAVAGSGRMDLIQQLAFPLPVIVIAELIGVPSEDGDRFKQWSTEVVKAMGVTSIQDARDSRRAGKALQAYFETIAAERRREPRDDLMSGLLAAEEAGDHLTSEEVFSTLNLLLIAGNETTTNLIGNGMLALLRNPDQFERLHREPELIDSAIDELLRYDGPVQATLRSALEDVEIDGKTIARGQNALLLLGAANHDPERFAEPERLDLGRADNLHLGFGHGVHYCLGSNLARLEARYAIRALVERFPQMKLAIDEPVFRPNMILRGLESLPVHF